MSNRIPNLESSGSDYLENQARIVRKQNQKVLLAVFGIAAFLFGLIVVAVAAVWWMLKPTSEDPNQSAKAAPDSQFDVREQTRDSENERPSQARRNVAPRESDVQFDLPEADDSSIRVEASKKEKERVLNTVDKTLDDKTVGEESVDDETVEVDLNGVRHMVWESDNMGWAIKSLAFSSNEIVYAGKMDRAIKVFDWKKSRLIDAKSKLELLGQVPVSTVSPDGSRLLTGGYSGRIVVWELDGAGKLKELATFIGHSKEIKSIAISPDGKFVCSGGSEKKFRIWELETCKEVHVFGGFDSAGLATKFSDDGKAVFATDGKTILKVNPVSGEVIDRGKLGRYYAHSVAFGNNGKIVAVSFGSEVGVFETETFEKIASFKGRGVQWALQFSPVDRYLFVGGSQVVTQWDWKNESRVNEFQVSSGYVQTFVVSNDGRYVAAIGSSAGQKLRVFRIPD